MKYHIVLKFVAIVLCTCFLVAALASAAAVISIAAGGLYGSTVQQIQEQERNRKLEYLAAGLAQQYAARELGGLTERLAEITCMVYQPSELVGDWYYTISDQDGNLLKSNVPADAKTERQTFWVDTVYPVILEHWENRVRVDKGTEPTLPQTATQSQEEKEPTTPAEHYDTRWVGYEDENGVEHEYKLGMYWGPNYEVTILLTEGAFQTEAAWHWQLAELGYQYRYVAIGVLFAALLLCSIAITYLCCAAGRAPGSDAVRPGGLNRIPLDLYALLVFGCGAAAVWLGVYIVLWAIDRPEEMIPAIVGVLGLGVLVCLLLVGFLFAFAAQVKVKGGFWWRHSVVGMTLHLCWKVLRRVISTLKRGFGWLFKTLGRFFGLLPLTWQWLVVAAGMGLMLLIGALLRSGVVLLFSIAVCIAVVIYGASCFGKLFEGARRMSRGNLGNKVSSTMMVGSFRDFAADLNALADVAVEAAKRQMTSERMKAELITNVSHDIKTPLTSIINYVDLLQTAETEAQRQQYLEVLARQSQRMKKLIEDLMEMSKASSGAMACELTRVDAAEAVNQALGEFADKLEQAGLVPIVRYPEVPTAMIADGRLTWRVLSNLLSNAVKYAMPGTRLYIDIVRLDGRVLISLKNISREPLNIAASELMERFVRGDASRNTEGSGLGLNIARSLMELQHGQLQLLIDGDLFKATMILPEAR